MKAAQIIILILLISCLINWCREGHFSESIFRTLPYLGGKEISFFDLAGILCIGWVIYRIVRLKNRE